MVFTEQTGLEKLYHMVAYAFDLSKCRRVLIARHFGEQFDSAQCKGMCDHCDTKYSGNTLKKDVTKYCKDILAVLNHARSTKQRVTGLKVLDAWMGKGATALRVSSVKAPQLQRSDCERVLLYLLIHNYIREDFHFTAYSTISYIVAGPRAQLLNQGNRAIEMELPGPVKRAVPTLTKSATAPAATKSASSEKIDKPKPKLSVINPQKSAFVPSVLTAGYQVDSDKSHDDVGKVKQISGSSGVEVVKRVAKKRPVIESDDDSDLDFCEDVPVKRTKKSAPLNSRRSKSEHHTDCIVLESDSDDERNETSGFEVGSRVGQNDKDKEQSRTREDKLSESKLNNSLPNEVQNGVIESDGD